MQLLAGSFFFFFFTRALEKKCSKENLGKKKLKMVC